MTTPWYWWILGKNQAREPGTRKRDKIRRLFSRDRTKICDCQPVSLADEPLAPPEIQPVADAEPGLMEIEPVVVEEAEPKDKATENFTLLKLLRLGWMRSQNLPKSEQSDVRNASIQSNNMPRSLYLLEQIGRAPSTTEVSVVTGGMQA